MKRVLVNDVAAEYGGAITVLENFIEEAAKTNDIHWTILVSKPNIEAPLNSNVEIKTISWPKRSWVHRLYFELIYMNYVYKLSDFDVILSLQNILLLRKSICAQKVVLVHQSIQFYDGRFSFFKLEGIKLNIRKYLLGQLIRISTQYSNYVLVQTHWMKEAISKWGSRQKAQLVKTPIDVLFDDNVMFDEKSWDGSFFYPAHAGYAKNHSFIIDVLRTMKERNLLLPKIYLTVDKEENNTAKQLYRWVQKYDLPVVFLGRLTKEQMLHHYQSSIVIFPSEIETFGLPLVEARSMNTPVLAIDLPYAREVLNNYSNVHYFDSVDSAVQLVIKVSQHEVSWNPIPMKFELNSYPTLVEWMTTLKGEQYD